MSMFDLPDMLWTPSPNYSSRGGKKVRRIIVHDCEGSEQGSISWFAQSRSRVSAHAVLSADGTRLTRMVEWQNKAWHVKDFNSTTEGIEMAGFEAKGFDDVEWRAMASVVAWRLKANGLPPVWAPGDDGLGFASHKDTGLHGGGHTDPTTDSAIWNHFCSLVSAAYAEAHGVDILPRMEPPPSAPAGWKPSGSVRHDHDVGSLEWAQLELNALGYARPALLVDGLQGPNTARAISAFQAANGLYRDGVLGPKTTAGLEAAGGAQIAANMATSKIAGPVATK